MASMENTARSELMFGNFDIQETIGQGGMGVVYRARDVTLNRDVALKVLKDELRENPRVVARFRREAEAIASLDHPRIVQVFSVGAVGSIPFFAMEFIEGKPLNRILRRHRFLQWKPALQVARDVAEALAAAHDAGIIHRDIKPGNILVDRSGSAYVTDFGIAKVLTAETQLTVDGSKLGTPQYMSPERVQSQEITHESDLYSLGVVLFQMLTGRLPYDAHDPVELIRMIVVDPPKRVREYKPELPEDIERLVAYMIEKKPQDRPRSAGQVVELINRLLEGKPLFESDSGLDDALESLREEVSTPHTDPSVVAAPPSAWDEFVARLGRRWRGMPEWGRVLLIAVPLIVAAYLGGHLFATVGGRDTAPDIVRAFSIDQSAWHREGELIRFETDGGGVETLRLALDGFRVLDAGWSTNAAAIVEVSDGAAAGLCLIQPDQRGASLLVPVGRWRAEDSVLMVAPDTRTGLIARPAGDGESDLMLVHFDAAGLANTQVLARRVTAIAIHPEGSRAAVVRREGRTGHVIEEWWTDSPASQREPLYSSQQEIRGFSYGNGGASVVFQETTPDGIETNILDEGVRRRLLLGPVELVEDALNGAGDKLIVFEPAGERRNVVAFDAASGLRLQEFGEALDAAWVSGDRVAVVRPDADGAAQIWTVDDAGIAEQRTFLAGGVRPELSVRRDGTIAVPTADGVSVAIIRP